MPDGRRECGLVVVGAQSIIVLLSTMRFLKCVQYNADHWQSDGVENLLETFEQSRGRTQRHFLMKYHRLCCRLSQMSNQLPEYQFNQSLHQEECTFAMLISRSGVTRQIVGDACRCEEASKLVVYHIQLLAATGLSDPWLKLEIRVSHTPRSASQRFSRTRLLKETGSDNPIQAEECIPRVASESDGNHPQSPSSSSSACAPTRDNEVRPNHDRDLDDQDLDDRDAMIDCFCPDSVFALESPNTEVLPEIEGTNVRDETENLAVWGARKYWDAITQEELPAELTRAARQEELDFMQDWHVWDVVPITESWSVTGKAPLQGKWVDVNKGDLERPVVRSRYVAKEFANTKSDDFFSPTPPLEALRLLLSHAGLWEVVKHGGPQNSGNGRPEGALARICRTQLVCGTPARSTGARYVCTTEAKFIRHLRDGKLFSPSSWKARDL